MQEKSSRGQNPGEVSRFLQPSLPRGKRKQKYMLFLQI